MLNNVIAMGRLIRAPELRRTASGISVVSFTIACERDFKDKQSGEKQTDFIDIVAFRQTAEFVAKFFDKGRMAIVEGRLQIRDWKDKDGNNRRSAEVVADNVYFGDSKRDAADNANNGGFPFPGGTVDCGTFHAAGKPVDVSAGDFKEISDSDGELPF